jgi:O-antigen/teichoic acid export membrane protein
MQRCAFTAADPKSAPEIATTALRIFAMLQIGTALAAGYIVLGTILMLGNRPADQSIYVAAAVAINIGCNFLLAAAYGALGAAFATAVAAVLASILLHWMVRRRLALPI